MKLNTKTTLLAALILLLTTASPGGAAEVKLAWDPPSGTPVGYKVYWGEASRQSATAIGNYTNSLDAGRATTATVHGLQIGRTYYFAATAIYSDGESVYSNEVFKLIAELLPPGGLRILEVIRNIDVVQQEGK